MNLHNYHSEAEAGGREGGEGRRGREGRRGKEREGGEEREGRGGERGRRNTATMIPHTEKNKVETSTCCINNGVPRM